MNDPDAPLVLLDERGAIVRVTLNRPHAGNALALPLIEALAAAFAALAPREDIKVIVVAGAGGRIFCAGHDLGELRSALDRETPDEAYLARDFAALTALMQAIMAQPQIVIAEIEGVATAAGCELAAACDLALAASNARFAVPGVNIGFWCHTPQVQLIRAVGAKHAMMMLATGRLFPATHALEIGLVNALYPPEELAGAVEALAAEIAAKPASVLRQGKASFNRIAGRGIAEAYAIAREAAQAHILHPDAKEGITAFTEKRDPRWI
ncbi:enoyl-CoA hydratase-related protein [Sphingomonas lycopersici]|uniref:Enoyl-CoA hydratase domain-containing protein 3, mitochondrial n=1 Tax=Sphingomonas lycopersici TaxID=2951807 RepID=A0AA41Z604_9SPHN|nr:enoyl-CoA hydratase-related protein [Sphingomonas lycopersici]MCW6533236.1 enoyl-CoA hydratase-related protein [Sphingomonas lycopersici]